MAHCICLKNCQIIILGSYPIKLEILIKIDLKEEFSLPKECKRHIDVKIKVKTGESNRNASP